MAASKRVLLATLEHLGTEEFRKFKWYLQGVLESFPAIKKSQLENADREDTVDQMVQAYCINTIKVTTMVLREMNLNDLAEKLSIPTSKPTEIPVECQQKLKSKLRKKYQYAFEKITQSRNSTLLNKIYTEIHVTMEETGEVNMEHEVRQIETASRKPDRPETTIRQEDIFK
uniref:Pyrin domain-containing protein n=2 Tax=Dicentrarchus labrax TaxID=13489 RepID=A0A8P4K6Q4_DICLA